jgi:serine/threonine-protein kinase
MLPMPSESNPPAPPASPASARTAASDPRIGTTIAERYYIHALLGEGGMGKVYSGEHVLMHKRVAVKVLHKELTTVRDVVQRFEREAMAAANIDHPNVAAATDFGHLQDGSVFLVLEFVQGISLRSDIADGPLDVVRALHIARQIASGLAAAHARGIVHRDLKPENVMLVEKAGDADFVKVLDFGIAKVPIQEITERGGMLAGQIITKVGMIFGTPEYMAPEQALGQEVDGRADQYALGVMLFEMLAGRRPYQCGSQVGLLGQQLKGPTPLVSQAMQSTVAPDGLDELVCKMLATDRDQRFADTLEVVSGIEALLFDLQPNLIIRGSRPDASAAPVSVREGPISSRVQGGFTQRPEEPAPTSTAPLARAFAERWRRPIRGLRGQLVLALVGGLAVGIVGVSIGLLATARKPTRNAGAAAMEPSASAASAAREVEPAASAAANAAVRASAAAASAASASALSGAAAINAAVQLAGASSAHPFERAPTVELALARASGPLAMNALALKYPADASVIVELAKVQFAKGEFAASAGNVARALVVDPAMIDNAEVASLLWKAVQKRECGDSVFKLLEGPMGPRGSDILYDLATTPDMRRDIRARASQYFASGRYQPTSSPALKALIGLKAAATCEERKRLLEQAATLGDERYLPVLETLRQKNGCGPAHRDDCNACLRGTNVLERALDAIRARAQR